MVREKEVQIRCKCNANVMQKGKSEGVHVCNCSFSIYAFTSDETVDERDRTWEVNVACEKVCKCKC